MLQVRLYSLSLSRLDWSVQEASPVIPSLHRQRGSAPTDHLDQQPSDGPADHAEEEGDQQADGLHHGLVHGVPVQGWEEGLDVGPDVVPGHGALLHLLPGLVGLTAPVSRGGPAWVELVQRQTGTRSTSSSIPLYTMLCAVYCIQ